MPKLEELAIEMNNAGSEEAIKIRLTSQTLRVLDLRGMDKACEVCYLACPDMMEMRTLWCSYRGSRAIRSANLRLRVSFLAKCIQTMDSFCSNHY
mmetsp:Transcript_30006/g.68789  ORF Transcript_30006/g.68789 Transcript_30006/m.68789 type:complete len:95 (-) Transcript_30006:179-463(-)